MKSSALECIAHHGGSGTVLHTSAGIEPLGLGQQSDAYETTHHVVQAQQRCIADTLVDRDAEIGGAGTRNGQVCFHVHSSAVEIKGTNRKSPPPRFAGVWALDYRVFSGRLESECTDARNLVAAGTTAGDMDDLASVSH